MKQPNGQDGEYVRKRKLAPRHIPFGGLQRVSEMRRVRKIKIQSVTRQLLRSAAIEAACSIGRRRSPHPRATVPCAA